MVLKVANWSSYQSYKDRRPPWIRFHRAILDNFEYHSMSSNARALLPMLWLLASEDEDPVSGLIRISYERIAFRLRLSGKVVAESVGECIESGFIEQYHDSNESVTNSLQIRNQTVTPEERREKTETETDSAEREGKLPRIDFQELVDTWNTTAGQFCPKVEKLIESRKQALRHRLADTFNGSIANWKEYCTIIQLSGFLTGTNDRGWRADFDWALKPQNIAKVKEGKYTNVKPASGNSKPKHTGFEQQDYRAGADGFIVA